MVPAVFSQAGNHGMPNARRNRKRQSRRTGFTRQGQNVVCTRLSECHAAALIRKEEASAREASEQEASAFEAGTETELHLQEDGLRCPEANDTNELQPLHRFEMPAEDVSDVNAASETGAPTCVEPCSAVQDDASTECLSSSLESEDLHCREDRDEVLAAATPSRKTVRFDFEAYSEHEITPYGELYGAHPRTFVFDKDSNMIAAARGGFVSLAALSFDDDEEDSDSESDKDEPEVDKSPPLKWSDSDSEEEEDDGGWEAWLAEQPEYSPDEFHRFPEDEIAESSEKVYVPCHPDLDDRSGWDSWLESALGDVQDEFCHDDNDSDSERCSGDVIVSLTM